MPRQTERFTLRLTRPQLVVVMDSADLLGRVHVGQWGKIVEELTWNGSDIRPENLSKLHLAQDVLNTLGHRCMGSKGITECQERARVAHDLEQAARKALSAHLEFWEPLYVSKEGAPVVEPEETVEC